MANVFFKKGLLANLPESYSAGTFYVTTDERAMYLDIDDSTRIRLGDFIQVAAVENLPSAGASTSALYYCVKENILAKWNGSDWTQINKQPTAEEMKTLLGLGAMAYKSTVVEGDLDSNLAKKINDASAANHGHDNKDVLDGITADKVSAWDAAEQNAKDYADDLDEAMNARVEALEAIDHEHANKALLDTYTQTEADLADAVAKKHSHANADELAKFVDGDKAKYDAVVADHLTSADKTTLENAIKEAKKAGTDANTNIETYKVANDARVLAVEEDVAEITDGTNGILAQAKSYSDGKLSTARTEITAEIDADVKVVADELAGYKTSNDAALAGVKATAEAAAVKTEVETALAGKVDKVEGKSLIADSEIARLATLANYDDTQVKADIAKKADAEAMTTELGKKVDKVEGKDLISTSEIERLATLNNYDDTALAGRVTTAEGKITALETESAKHALKTEVEAVDAKFADYVTSASYATDKAGIDEAIADRYTKEEADGKFAIKGADAYDDTALSNRVKAIEDDYLVEADKTELAGLVTAEKERAEGIEGGLRTDVDAIKADYLKSSDKTELEGKIAAEETRAKGVEEGLQTQINTIMNNPDTEGVINSINEFTQYIADHGAIADGFRADIDKNKEDIAANAKAISDHAVMAAETYETIENVQLEVNCIYADFESLEEKVFTGIEDAGIHGLIATEAEVAGLLDTVAGLSDTVDELIMRGHYRGSVSSLDDITDPQLGDIVTIGDLEVYMYLICEGEDTWHGWVRIATQYDINGVNNYINTEIDTVEQSLATKANTADVYAKTETFTKDEVNAAIEAAVTAAHTWGEF